MKIGFTLKPNNGNILDFEKQLSDLEAIGANCAEIPLYELDVISGKKIIKDELNLLHKTIHNSNFNFSKAIEKSNNRIKNSDYIKLNNGQEAVVRTWRTVKGGYHYTELGKKFQSWQL